MNEPAASDIEKRRRARSWAIFAALLVFVALIYAVTIVKIKAGYAP